MPVHITKIFLEIRSQYALPYSDGRSITSQTQKVYIIQAHRYIIHMFHIFHNKVHKYFQIIQEHLYCINSQFQHNFLTQMATMASNNLKKITTNASQKEIKQLYNASSLHCLGASSGQVPLHIQPHLPRSQRVIPALFALKSS